MPALNSESLVGWGLLPDGALGSAKAQDGAMLLLFQKRFNPLHFILAETKPRRVDHPVDLLG